MTVISPLPHHESENAAFAALSAPELVDCLIENEDRVPRHLIDECAARGEPMIATLRDALAAGLAWDADAENGEWWLTLHAVMVLGLMREESAGILLTEYMRRLDEEQDEDMQDWLSGRWPALFRNKPATVMPALRALSEDRELEWYMRADAVESVIAHAENVSTQTLDDALDWAAAMAADKKEALELRLSAGSTILNFAPARYRALLDSLAGRQLEIGAVFTATEVSRAYASGGLEKQWERFANPWEFFTPDAIEERQRRWAQQATYVRESPKVGRNDPCPCGSGKKFKKCCIDAHPR